MSQKYKQKHFKTYRGISWEQFETMHAPIPLVAEEKAGPNYPSRAGIVPRGFWMCQNSKELCPCCALFGMTEQAAEGKEEKAAPLAGRVRFTDAMQAGDNREIEINVPYGIGPPHPYHRQFYFDNEGFLLGRKFYYHHRDYKQTLEYYEGAKHIVIKAQEGKFIFTVRFHNLREDELAVLVYSLMLEDDLRHHLGYGKPFGLGTVKITISEMRLMHFKDAKPSRYLDYDEQSGQSTWDIGDAVQWRDNGKKLWTGREGAQKAYDKFKEILKYPQTQNFRYPTYNWFRGSKNKNATLAQYQSNPSMRT
jgi:CRISPR-associated protein (TIGR03986 family)